MLSFKGTVSEIPLSGALAVVSGATILGPDSSPRIQHAGNCAILGSNGGTPMVRGKRPEIHIATPISPLARRLPGPLEIP